MVLLLATAFILRAPLRDAASAHIRQIDADAAEREAQAKREALERAFTSRLDACAQALQELREAAVSFQKNVEAALGLPLSAARAQPPTRLRHLMLNSDAFLKTWTTLINTYVTPEELAAQDQSLSQIRANLRHGLIRDEAQSELDRLDDWIRDRTHHLNAAESLLQTLTQLLDGTAYPQTAHAVERR
jgi:hypothetical protein